MISWKCSVCDSKIWKFIKEQEASGLLSSIKMKTPPIGKISLVGPILFKEYKMIKIVNMLLLAGDRFMPEMHL